MSLWFCRSRRLRVLGNLERGFKRNLFAVRVHPVDIESCVGTQKDKTWSGAEAGCAVNVARRHIDKIAVMRYERSLTLHLSLQGAADDHHCFVGRVPMKRSDASRSKFGKDNGRAFGGVAALDRYGKTFRRVWNRTEFSGSRRGNNWFFI